MMLRNTSLLVASLTLALFGAAACGGKGGKKDTAPEVVSFTADPASLVGAGTVTLAWETKNATAVAITDGDGQAVDLGGADAAAGSVDVTLDGPGTYEYTLSATGAEGTEPATAKVTVTVDPNPAPQIASFTASPATITAGESSTLAWTTTDAESLTLVDDQGNTIDLSGQGVASGSVDVSPSVDTTYTLTATGPGGTVTATVTVSVLPLPVIVDFSADQTNVLAGADVVLSWTTTDADTVAIADDQGNAVDLTGQSAASGSVTVSPSLTTTYTLTATNANGSVTADVTINVLTVIASFTVTPGVARSGDTVTLAWQIGGATSASITGPGSFSYTVPDADLAAGQTTTTATAAGDYVLTAVGPGNQASATATLALTTGPVVYTFSASPAAITAGETTTLSWTTGGATSLQLTDSAGNTHDISAQPMDAGTFDVTLSAPGTVTFTLTATNVDGTDTATTDVTVEAIPAIDTFAAAPTRVPSGGTATLTWTTSNATSVRLEENGTDLGIGATDTSYTTGPLAADTTYVLYAANSLGYEVASAPVTVTIGAPVNQSFTATPDVAAPGDTVTLAWQNDGGTSLTITDDGGATVCSESAAAAVASGSCQVTAPSAIGTYVYTLDVSDGTSSDTATVTLNVSDGPIIRSFTASAAEISEGDTLTLSWAVDNDPSGATPTLTLTDDQGGTYDVSAADPNNGTFDVTGLMPGTYVFTLTASTGATTTDATATVTVTVYALPAIVTFDATPRSLDTQGGTVTPTTTFSWTTQNATVAELWELDAAGSPTTLVYAAASQAEVDAYTLTNHPVSVTTDFRLHVENAIGGAVEQDVRVVVDGPVVSSFTATDASGNPVTDVYAGETVTLTWTTQRADTASLDPQPIQLTSGLFQDISGDPNATALTFSSSDTGEATITFPSGFSFPYYGTPRTEAMIATDGFLSFDITTQSSFSNDPIPNSATPNGGVIAPLWDDLHLKSTGVAHYLLVPNANGPDALVIQWSHMQFWSSSSNPADLNFQIVLYDNGDFEVNYGTMTASNQVRADGNSASIGFEDDTGSRGVEISLNTAWPGGLSNQGWKVLSQVQPNGSVQVSPTANTTYTLTANNANGSDSATVSLVVHPAAQITATGYTPAQPDAGAPFDVTWTTQDATKVEVSDAGGNVLCTFTDPALVASGTCSITETTAGTYDYTVTATGQLTRNTVSQTVTVQVYPALLINAWTASDGTTTSPTELFITNGRAVTLAWDVTGAQGFQILEGTTDITPANPGATGTLGVNPGATTTYTLQISDDPNFAIGSRKKSATVTVYVDAAQVTSFGASSTQVVAGSSSNLSWTTSGTVDSVTLTPANVTTTTGNAFTSIVGAGGTDVTPSNLDNGQVTITPTNGFSFPFDGQVFTSFEVSTNGILYFTPTSSSLDFNDPIPTVGGAAGFIAPFWDDLNGSTGTSTIAWASGGLSPNRTLVVEWNGFHRYLDPGTLTFQVVLHENGDVDINYIDMTASSSTAADAYAGGSATVGVENLTEDGGVQILYNTPDPSLVGPGIQHHIPLGTLSATGSMTVQPQQTTTYKLCATGGGYTDCKTVTVVVVRPGDVLITEIMVNPSAATGDGRWFEVTNTSANVIDLQGWTVTESGGGTWTIPTGTPVPIAPGQYMVFAASADTTTNGGVSPDLVYDPALVLDAPADSLTLTYGGVVIDDVAWDASFPQQAGASMAFSAKPAAADPTQNDAATAWSIPVRTYGDGDLGTPGQNNRNAVLLESFSSWPPNGWSVEDGSGDGVTWGSCTEADLSGSYTFQTASGTFACVVSTGANPLVEGLISPAFDLSVGTSATLTFAHNYQHYSGQPDFGVVEFSTDGGTSWTEVTTYNTDTSPSSGVVETLDLTPAMGNASVILRFRYEDAQAASWFWAIDEVEVVVN